MGSIRKASASAALCASCAFLLTLAASRAYADTISPGYNLYVSDGNGDLYTLDVNSVTGDTYDITFTIDTTNYSGPSGFLDAWSLQFTGSTDLTILSASNGTWSDPVSGPTGAKGCQKTPGNMWCSEATGGSGLPLGGGVYTWELTMVMPNGTTWSGDSHVQALYGNCSDIDSGCSKSHNLISADFSVPEPGSLTLLGVGLVTMVGLLRRKLFA